MTRKANDENFFVEKYAIAWDATPLEKDTQVRDAMLFWRLAPSSANGHWPLCFPNSGVATSVNFWGGSLIDRQRSRRGKCDECCTLSLEGQWVGEASMVGGGEVA